MSEQSFPVVVSYKQSDKLSNSSFILNSGQMTCVVEIFGHEDNFENWEQFVEKMEEEGEYEMTLSYGHDGHVAIMTEGNLVFFSFERNKKGSGGSARIGIPSTSCKEAIKLHMEHLNKK